MSIAFQDRFKGRITTIGKTGEIIARSDTETGQSAFSSSLLSPNSGTMLTPRIPLPLSDFHPRKTIESLQFVRPICLRPNQTEETPKSPTDSSLKLPTNSYRACDFLPNSETARLIHQQSSPTLTRKSAIVPAYSLTVPPQRQSVLSKSGDLETIVSEVNSEKRASQILSEAEMKSRSMGASPTKESGARIKAAYTPYTLKDYHSIKGENYLEMGVFGPSTIGSEEWSRRKLFQDRRKAYAQGVLQSNSNQIAIAQYKPKVKEESPIPSTRMKALAFAKTIKPPVGKRLEGEWDYQEEERKRMRQVAEEMRRRLLE